MLLGLLCALVGVLHVHHEPSHDTDAPFSAVLEAAIAADLDFVVLTEHTDAESGPLPAAERAGRYPKPDGGELLVLVGAELGTADGHLLAYAISELVPAQGRPGAQVIDAIHARGGFAVVPHPLSYGGWRDWSASFDGIEVHNNAAAFRALWGPLLPLRLLRYAVDRRGGRGAMLRRPAAELELWDRLLAQGRRVVGFSGADAHQNASLLGWQLDPYLETFRSVQTWCPDGPLEPAALWAALRGGQCWIRYQGFADLGEPQRRRLPSGRVELGFPELDRVLELHQPPAP